MDVLVKCVSVSMSFIFQTCRGGVSNVAYGRTRITTLLILGHLLDLRAAARGYLLARHQSDDPGQNVRGQHGIAVDHASAVDLQVSHRPRLIKYAQADAAIPIDSSGLAALLHRGDEQVIVAVHDVVDDRHRRAVLLAGIAEDACAVVADELAPLFLIHWRPLRIAGSPYQFGSLGTGVAC